MAWRLSHGAIKLQRYLKREYGDIPMKHREEKFAQKIGCSPHTVHKWWTGERRRISEKFIDKIRKLTKIDANDWYLGG